MVCKIENCGKASYARELCKSCYYQDYTRRNSGSCAVVSCFKVAYKGGLCLKHSRIKETADRRRELERQKRWARRGAKAPKPSYRQKSLKQRFNHSKAAALRRGLEWKLSYEQYEATVGTNLCFYGCGNSLPKVGSGLDRIDNSIGYQSDNVLPCCAGCNRGRGEENSVEEWKIMIEARSVYRKAKASK